MRFRFRHILFYCYIVCYNSYVYVDYQDFLSEREKVKFLFSTFDISEKNDYLGYDELELFQRLTDPQLPLDVSTYRYIVSLLGGNLRYGLTMSQFNSSYYLHRHALGTDLHKDYSIIKKLIVNAM